MVCLSLSGYRLPLVELGLDPQKDYLTFEFWSGKFAGVQRGAIEARVEAQSNVLLAVHERKGHPQFLSTNRHVTQGRVELMDVAWDEPQSRLFSRVKLVENDALTLSLHVPEGYAFQEATAEEARVVNISGEAPVKPIRLSRSTSGEATLVASFTRRNQ
jgi:hypothetical protein